MAIRPRQPGRATAATAAFGIGWAGWMTGTLLTAWLREIAPDAASNGVVLTLSTAVAGTAAALMIRRLRSDPIPCIAIAGLTLALSARPVGSTIGLAEPGPVPWLAVVPYLLAATAASLVLTPAAHRLVRASAAIVAVIVVFATAQPAGAWIASASLRQPTDTMARTNNVDVSVDTHQWLAKQAITILATDGRRDIAAFLATADPTAPAANDPATGLPSGTTDTYGWRLLQGARDADGTLYPQIPDHFHNWWTHQGKWWIVGGSAANGAEKAFSHAIEAWKAQDRSTAIYWLGAALHLVDDSCVPQHEFYGLNVYHHQYERWVQIHQNTLAVDSGGIYADQFRVGTGHGGPQWSSSQPRGWVDECAHRAAANLLAATHPNPPQPSTSGSQWRTAPHVADTQRLSAGFVAFFFDTVGAP
jgi:hypothetical protein